MTASHNQWDHQKLETAIRTEDIPLIQELWLSSQSTLDLLGWGYTDFGLYTVKFSY